VLSLESLSPRSPTGSVSTASSKWKFRPPMVGFDRTISFAAISATPPVGGKYHQWPSKSLFGDAAPTGSNWSRFSHGLQLEILTPNGTVWNRCSQALQLESFRPRAPIGSFDPQWKDTIAKILSYGFQLVRSPAQSLIGTGCQHRLQLERLHPRAPNGDFYSQWWDVKTALTMLARIIVEAAPFVGKLNTTTGATRVLGGDGVRRGESTPGELHCPNRESIGHTRLGYRGPLEESGYETIYIRCQVVSDHAPKWSWLDGVDDSVRDWPIPIAKLLCVGIGQ